MTPALAPVIPTAVIATAFALRAFGYVPHALATVGCATVELISYPYPFTDRAGFGVMARATPGDPTSLVQLEIPAVAVDLAQCAPSGALEELGARHG